jgi:cell division protein FtsI (penicillin-binding protein 3)
VAATSEPQATPQTIAFRPADQRRVISTMTAAEMKQMMQGVVLTGTGRKAILEGYSSAGKTGTAQKVDPATHTYSRTKYVASFAGFAPVNNPAITVAVIIDSPLGQHHGADVSAPVFQRIAQQVLEYLHTPHDIELPTNRQVLMAARHVNQQDEEEGSPDHLGEPLEMAENTNLEDSNSKSSPLSKTPKAQVLPNVIPAAMHERVPIDDPAKQPGAAEQPESSAAVPPQSQSGATVVLDIEQGGVVVPSFLGKTVRAAVETAEENGIDLDVAGSGLAQQQQPAPGSRVAAGTRVAVQFGR